MSGLVCVFNHCVCPLYIVNASGTCTYGDVRLVGGSNQYEGRVEVCRSHLVAATMAIVRMLELDVKVFVCAAKWVLKKSATAKE